MLVKNHRKSSKRILVIFFLFIMSEVLALAMGLIPATGFTELLIIVLMMSTSRLATGLRQIYWQPILPFSETPFAKGGKGGISLRLLSVKSPLTPFPKRGIL
jgi:hypothetical protein